MIDFGNPWMLLGLCAAAVPIALHLFGRRHAPTIRFAALAFILATHPREARALRVNEWLLVAVRALAVALVAVALARPMIALPGAAVAAIDAGDRPVAAVIVLDDSMSTRARTGGSETVFDRLRARALATVERLPAGSKVAVVASGYPARLLTRQLTGDRSAVLDAIRLLPHHPRKDDAARALLLADNVLQGADLDDRRLLVLTDLQASGWQGVALPPQGRAAVPVRLRVDRTEPMSRENAAIVDAVVQPQSDRGPDQVRLDVTVQHYGERAWQGLLTVKVAEREWQSLLELAPGGSAMRSFQVPVTAPVAEIRLPDDVLDVDNVRQVRLDGAAGVRVAIVNGAPRPVPREDEAWFLARALELSSERPGALTVDTLQLPGLTAEALREYDVLVLANIAELPTELGDGIAAAVQAGKGLLVTVGDNLPAETAAWLPGLLPMRVFGQRAAETTAAHRQRPTTALRVETTTAHTAATTAMQRLRAALVPTVGETLGAVTVRRHALLEPSAELADQAVLRYADGAPALVMAPKGRGQVALLTTTIDLDWADLALQPGFLPLVSELVRSLAGERGLERRGAVDVSEVAVLGRDPRATDLEVKLDSAPFGPPGPTLSLPAVGQRGQAWQIVGLDQPGRYTATELHNGTALTSRLLVTVPPLAESRLGPVRTGALLTADLADRHAGRQVAKSPAWSGVILILLGLLLFEGMLILRGGLLGRPPRASAPAA